MISAFSLHRLLAQQLLTAGEDPVKLIVKVVAICQDDERRILHGRVLDDLPGVKQHGEALAAALSMPDDADTLIPCGTGGFEGMFYGFIDRMKLMVGGHLLSQPGVSLLEDHEIT